MVRATSGCHEAPLNIDGMYVIHRFKLSHRWGLDTFSHACAISRLIHFHAKIMETLLQICPTASLHIFSDISTASHCIRCGLFKRSTAWCFVIHTLRSWTDWSRYLHSAYHKKVLQSRKRGSRTIAPSSIDTEVSLSETFRALLFGAAPIRYRYQEFCDEQALHYSNDT